MGPSEGPRISLNLFYTTHRDLDTEPVNVNSANSRSTYKKKQTTRRSDTERKQAPPTRTPAQGGAKKPPAKRTGAHGAKKPPAKRTAAERQMTWFSGNK